MSESLLLQRRLLLKILSGAPLLPIAASSSVSALLAACGGDADGSAAGSRPGNDNGNGTSKPTRQLSAVSFTSSPAPKIDDPTALASVHVRSAMIAEYSDGSQQSFALHYEPFFVTGDMVPDGKGGTILAGGTYDANNAPIIDTKTQEQAFSVNPDGSSLLTVPNAKIPGVKGNPVFAVVQFEEKVAGMAVLTLDQDPATGKLTLVKYSNVDLSKVHGLWTTCGASLTPWDTHLSSEEYAPDPATGYGDIERFSKSYFHNPTRANPYHYGFTPEITVLPDGTGIAQKHYCMGRLSHEVTQVMPDRRTALMGNDWTNGGLYMFIADREADLSSGTLYVAKWHQTSGTGPGAADLSWIRLGSASDAEIKSLADSLKVNDIMDVKRSDPKDMAYTRILFNGAPNWVKQQPGQEKAAAFLETSRYAALKGGSLGFTKMEGTTVNAKDKVAYVAMSYIEKSMLKGHAANAGDIQVEGPSSGAVYELKLAEGQRDSEGNMIDSTWVPTSMAAIASLVGEDLSEPDAMGNRSHVDKIANPDNLKFSGRMRTLFIGEDSDRHMNNFLWAYHVDTKKLSRILSVPVGAESTGLHAVDEINGWTYIMSNFQHPGEWQAPAQVQDAVTKLIDDKYKEGKGAAVGYLTGAPVRLAT